MTKLEKQKHIFSEEEKAEHTKQAYEYHLENHNKGNAHSILVVNLFRKNLDLIEKITPRQLDLGFGMLNQLVETNGAKNLKQSLIYSFGKDIGKELGEKLEKFDTKPKVNF